jgi:hypothetical protein
MCDLKKIIVTHVIMIFDLMYRHEMKVGKLLDDLIQMTYNRWALSSSFFQHTCHFGDISTLFNYYTCGNHGPFYQYAKIKSVIEHT